jgi:hypothetical protein
MVSEGDLIGRDENAREARRDWWLALVAEGGRLAPDCFKGPAGGERLARDVMAAPVVAVAPETDDAEIARLLSRYRIKRVPVVREGRIEGIVSRADLLRALAQGAPGEPPRHEHGLLAGLRERLSHGREAAAGTAAQPQPSPGKEGVTAAMLRELAADFGHGKAARRDAERRKASEQRDAQVKSLIDHHVGDDTWAAMLHMARDAARHGEAEVELLRFPASLCSDGGRAINVFEEDWPATLRGEAAEIYLRWHRELRPRGFHLAARVLDFPGGMPGDIGLFLIWGT